MTEEQKERIDHLIRKHKIPNNLDYEFAYNLLNKKYTKKEIESMVDNAIKERDFEKISCMIKSGELSDKTYSSIIAFSKGVPLVVMDKLTTEMLYYPQSKENIKEIVSDIPTAIIEMSLENMEECKESKDIHQKNIDLLYDIGETVDDKIYSFVSQKKIHDIIEKNDDLSEEAIVNLILNKNTTINQKTELFFKGCDFNELLERGENTAFGNRIENVLYESFIATRQVINSEENLDDTVYIQNQLALKSLLEGEHLTYGSQMDLYNRLDEFKQDRLAVLTLLSSYANSPYVIKKLAEDERNWNHIIHNKYTPQEVNDTIVQKIAEKGKSNMTKDDEHIIETLVLLHPLNETSYGKLFAMHDKHINNLLACSVFIPNGYKDMCCSEEYNFLFDVKERILKNASSYEDLYDKESIEDALKEVSYFLYSNKCMYNPFEDYNCSMVFAETVHALETVSKEYKNSSNKSKQEVVENLKIDKKIKESKCAIESISLKDNFPYLFTPLPYSILENKTRFYELNTDVLSMVDKKALEEMLNLTHAQMIKYEINAIYNEYAQIRNTYELCKRIEETSDFLEMLQENLEKRKDMQVISDRNGGFSIGLKDENEVKKEQEEER